jgi:hypothetical protein
MGLTTDFRTLINRGRKAGLNTRELYSALATRGGEADGAPGRTDTNGYVSTVTASGRRVYRPLSGGPPA